MTSASSSCCCCCCFCPVSSKTKQACVASKEKLARCHSMEAEHGGRACIFNVNVPYVGEKTGNEELITMLVCRDTDCFHGRLESSVLLWKKSSDIGRTEPMAHGSSESRRWLTTYTDWTNASNGTMRIENIQARAALMPSKPDSPPLFLFSPQWCDALLTRCPPCQHQPALARLMRRLQGAEAPRLLLGGWAQPSGRLPRVLPSAEAESSRRDFAAEVERNESGGRARCWEMEAAPALPPSIKGAMQLTRDDITPTEARWARRVTKDASCVGLLSGHQALVVRAGSQGQSHTPEVMQAGITLHSSSGNMTRLRLHDPEEQLRQRQRKFSGFFVSAVTIRSSPR